MWNWPCTWTKSEPPKMSPLAIWPVVLSQKIYCLAHLKHQSQCLMPPHREFPFSFLCCGMGLSLQQELWLCVNCCVEIKGMQVTGSTISPITQHCTKSCTHLTGSLIIWSLKFVVHHHHAKLTGFFSKTKELWKLVTSSYIVWHSFVCFFSSSHKGKS